MAHLTSAHARAGSQLHGAGSVVVPGLGADSCDCCERDTITERRGIAHCSPLLSVDNRDKSHGQSTGGTWGKRDQTVFAKIKNII